MTSMPGYLDTLAALPLARQGSFWFPPQASSVAAGTDLLYDIILWLCVLFFVGICGTTILFVARYRKRPGHKEQKTSTHNLILEVTWSVVPLIMLMVVFGVSMYWYLEMINPPRDEKVYDITVRGQKWSWSFKYEGDPFESQMVTPRLHVIKDQAYRLVMDSPDVIHSMYLPAFRVKQDCVPGRYNKLWFRPTMAGEFPLYCTEYCGDDHSNMITTVVVHEDPNAWRDWIIKEGDLKNQPPVQRGQIIWERNCKICHTIDGKKGTGPSFKGIWGKEEEMSDGSRVIVDEAYVRESLNEPGKRIVKGYPNSMTPFKFQDYEYEGIYAFLKSLKDK
ncbi:MAG: cytochrome c oxidase subunit II [Planctomycetes bacterium]|nr:cytochrome c oxidase subunit II [Planctomycetota bacterium]